MKWKIGAAALAAALLGLVGADAATAGTSSGFAQPAHQGITRYLNQVYGPGNSPYKVRCSEVDHINYPTGEIHDTVTCVITGP